MSLFMLSRGVVVIGVCGEFCSPQEGVETKTQCCPDSHLSSLGKSEDCARGFCSQASGVAGSGRVVLPLVP